MTVKEIQSRLRLISADESLTPQERHDILVQIRNAANCLAMQLVDEYDLLDDDDQFTVTDEDLDDFDDDWGDWDEVEDEDEDEDDDWNTPSWEDAWNDLDDEEVFDDYGDDDFE